MQQRFDVIAGSLHVVDEVAGGLVELSVAADAVLHRVLRRGGGVVVAHGAWPPLAVGVGWGGPVLISGLSKVLDCFLTDPRRASAVATSKWAGGASWTDRSCASACAFR